MAELYVMCRCIVITSLDRTDKPRIDWALTAAAAYPTKIISFAWDADYLCIPKGTPYTMSLADEIYTDYMRPIVSYLDRNAGVIRGFNLMQDGRCTATYDVMCSSGKTFTGMTAAKGDDHWGSNNNKHALLQQVIVPQLSTLCPATDQHVCIHAVSGGLRTFHEYCHEL